MCSRVTIHSNLQDRDQCQDIVSLVYHGISAKDDVIVPVTTESVFISPHGRVTVNLFTCFSLNVDTTHDLGLAIRYEPSGMIPFTRQAVCKKRKVSA